MGSIDIIKPLSNFLYLNNLSDIKLNFWDHWESNPWPLGKNLCTVQPPPQIRPTYPGFRQQLTEPLTLTATFPLKFSTHLTNLNGTDLKKTGIFCSHIFFTRSRNLIDRTKVFHSEISFRQTLGLSLLCWSLFWFQPNGSKAIVKEYFDFKPFFFKLYFI